MAQTRRREGLLARIRLSFTSNRLAATLWLITGLLSIASVDRTLEGMLSYLAPDPSERTWSTVIVTLCLTLGLQGLMVASAWNFGEYIVHGLGTDRSLAARMRWLRKIALQLVIFLITMAVAVFFSYNAFYRAITSFVSGREEVQAAAAQREDGKAATEPGTAMTEAEKAADRAARGNRSPHIDRLARDYVQNEVSKSLTTMYNDARAEQLRYLNVLTKSLPPASPTDWLEKRPAVAAAAKAWGGFDGRMRDILGFAEQSKQGISRKADELADEARERNVKEQERLEEIKAKRTKAESALRQAEADERRLTEVVKAREQELLQADKKIEGLSNQLRLAANRMECELQGRQCEDAPPTNPGRGPLYNKAKAEHDDHQLQRTQAMANRKDIDDKLREEQRALKESIGRKTEASSIIGVEETRLTGRQRGGAVVPVLLKDDELAAEIRRMKTALEGLTKPEAFGMPPAKADQPGVDPKGAAEGVAAAGAAATEKAPLLQLEESCFRIVAHLSNAAFDTSKRAQSMSCARDGLTAGITPIQELNAGLDAFVAKGCRTVGGQFRQANTNKLIQRGYECLEISRLDGEPEEKARRTLSLLEGGHNKEVHPFAQAIAGFRNYGDTLAYLSLAVAIILDTLIFFTGLLGTKAGLARVDRRGEDEGGSDVFRRLDAINPDRTELLDRFLQKVKPDLHHFKEGGPLYSGYISADDMHDDADDGAEVRRFLRVISREKDGVPWVVRWPKGRDRSSVDTTGLWSVQAPDAEPVRFFILGSVLDTMEDMLASRKRAFTTPAQSEHVYPPQREIFKRGAKRIATGFKNGFADRSRAQEGKQPPPGAGQGQPAGQDDPADGVKFHERPGNGAASRDGPKNAGAPPGSSSNSA